MIHPNWIYLDNMSMLTMIQMIQSSDDAEKTRPVRPFPATISDHSDKGPKVLGYEYGKAIQSASNLTRFSITGSLTLQQP